MLRNFLMLPAAWPRRHRRRPRRPSRGTTGGEVGSSSAPSPGDGKFVDTVGQRVVFEWQLFHRHGQAQRRDTSEQGRQYDLQLHSGELLANALMATVAEADMWTLVTAQIQSLRVRELALVPIRRRHIENDALTGANRFAVDLDVLG